MSERLTFRKKERLCSTKLLGKLFQEGSSFYRFPLKVVYLVHDLNTEHPVQAAFSVSKKYFRNATDRNLIRRKMKEAYRLNKMTVLPELHGSGLSVLFIYIARDIRDYSEIERSLQLALKKINSVIGTLTCNSVNQHSPSGNGPA